MSNKQKKKKNTKKINKFFINKKSSPETCPETPKLVA